jgi:ubiquinone/menaquinone biosynthesis C-methylase UbiE
MGVAMSERREYIFEDRAAEQERLLAQASLLDPSTRRLLVEAGLAPGMRVLDLGTGMGSVAGIAAELVGPGGAVVGVDRDPGAVEHAREHVARLGLGNVEFRTADAQTLEGVEGGFDAVVGRLILLYLADPAEALRQAAARTRPGGVICMHEADFTYLWSSSQTPLWRQVQGWWLDTLAKAGVAQRMGPSLFATFRAAGLPDPRMLLAAFAGGGSQAPSWGFANLIRGILPLMVRLGVASRDEVDPETLTDRLQAEIDASDAYIACPIFGAWSTVPSE